MGARLTTWCTCDEAVKIIRLDRRISEYNARSLWRALCNAATNKIESKLMYGKVLELAQDGEFIATIEEGDRQALKRLAALLEGQLSDELGRARLTFAQLKAYLAKRGYRPADMSTLWTSVVGSGLGIYIRTDMGIDQYAVSCALIQKMIEASPGSYHRIGASSQKILREWLESIGRLD